MKAKQLLLAFLIPAIIFSCTKEEAVPSNEKGNTTLLEVALPSGVKTSLSTPEGKLYHVLWSAGDSISVGGVVSLPLGADKAGTDKAVFEFSEGLTAPFNIIYPGTSSADKVAIPASQAYSAGTFDAASAPMWGVSNGFSDAALHHLTGIIRIRLTGSEKVRMIRLNALAAETLSGEFALGKDSAGAFDGSLTRPETGVNAIILDCGAGVQLDAANATDFFIAVPKGTYAKGFCAEVITTESKQMKLFLLGGESDRKVDAATVYEFPAKAFTPGESVTIISTPADLAAFAANAASVTKAVLTNDIDMTGKTWSAVTGFMGELDGGGFEIKGLSTALFSTLEGATVRNLVVNSTFKTSSRIIGILATSVKAGTKVTNCVTKGAVSIEAESSAGEVHFGGIAGENISAYVSGCTNKAELTLDKYPVGASQKYHYYVGGIVGIDKGASDYEQNCVNEGRVIINAREQVADSPSFIIFAGGVFGRTNQVKRCQGNGAVTVTENMAKNEQCFIGGVAGLCDGVFENCSGSGTVEFNARAASSARTMVGGLVGDQRGNLSNCSFSGKLSVKTPNSKSAKIYQHFTGIGGIAGCTSANAITVTNLEATADAVVEGVPNISASYATSMGGLIGRIMSNTTMTACTNRAAVTLKGGTLGQESRVAGIVGDIYCDNSTVSGCTNYGTVKCDGNCAYLILGGLVGCIMSTEAATAVVKDCTNEGLVGLYEQKSAVGEVCAGGIIGNVSSFVANKTLTFTASNLVNNGKIDRFIDGMTKRADFNSRAGGIVGMCGDFRSGIDKASSSTSTDKYYVEGLIENCTNNGQMIFNQFCGQGNFIDTASSYNFTGGIMGECYCSKGCMTIKCCLNTGNILSTAGYSGGIVGYAQSGIIITGEKTAEGVKYTKNVGTIGMWDIENVKEKGSGGLRAGGICAYLKASSVHQKVTYCWNDGIVAGSDISSKPAGAGGICANMQIDGGVQYCKNSGKVRVMATVSNSDPCRPAMIAGLISDYVSCKVKDCGVGGVAGFASKEWVNIEESGNYGIEKYLYAGNSFSFDLIETFAPGCVFWNGVDKLSWEE